MIDSLKKQETDKRMENIVVCSWKTDESPVVCQISKTQNGTNTIEIDASSVHSPVNLMAEIKDIPELYWFAVNIVDLGDNNNNNGSISVGAVTIEEFNPGYKIKGMFYNGNLTNGCAGLTIGYGPYIQRGDFCVLECSATTTDTKSTFSMTIHVNGTRVGKGFEITNTAPSSNKFVPCVHITGKAKFTAKVTTEKPPNLLQSIVVQKQQRHPLNGEWEIVEATNRTKQFLPIKKGNIDRRRDNLEVTMNLVVNNCNSSLSFSVKVSNTMRIVKEIKLRPDDGTVYDLTSTGGPPMMTRMISFYDTVESELSSAMTDGWKSIGFLPDNENEFKIFGGDTSPDADVVVVARCIRKTNNDVAPLTSYI